MIMMLLILLLAGSILGTRVYSAWATHDQIYTLDRVPYRPVTIIFGALVHDNGRLSHMLEDRVALGAALYAAGKTDVLLMTGDNHIVTYNEPEAMRDYAIKLGVPESAIVLDYAGFRTYDSCYRARDIFKVREAILVTQDFHLDRALLTCNQLGIDSIGVAADEMRPEGYNERMLRYSQMREFPATWMAVVDLVRDRQPTFLGDPLPIVTAKPKSGE